MSACKAAELWSSIELQLQERTRELKALSLLRTRENNAQWNESLKGLAQQITVLEVALVELKARLAAEKQCLTQNAEVLKDLTKNQRTSIENLEEKIRTHEQTTQTKPTQPAITAPLTLAPVAVTSAPKGGLPKPTIVVRTQDSKQSLLPHIEHITQVELAAVPQYMRGRLKLDTLNECVDEIIKILQAKYKLMATPAQKVPESQRAKYWAYKELETHETKGFALFSETDFHESSVLRAIDPAGRIVIPVLKHVKRISELTVKCQRCWLVQS